MVTKEQGKRMIEEIVGRYRLVEDNWDLVKKRVLSEQDISTKFVLPMLCALNWDPLKIMPEGPEDQKGPEIHEKGFRERGVEGGLPDFSLRSPSSKTPFFVEVKHPSLHLNLERALKKYKDGHVVFLPSFRESMLVRIGKNKKKEICKKFVACSPELYVKRFDNLWNYISNSYDAEDARRALKAWRHGQR